MEQCNGLSKKIVERCMGLSSALPVFTGKLADEISQRCCLLFDESSAVLERQAEQQAERAARQSLEAAAMVNKETDELLQRQQEQLEQHQKEDEKNGTSAKQLAHQVADICTKLSKETADSCEAITRCIAEMVRTM